ncbi:HAD family hydrolase [Streptomyces californicus]|uniref:HAD family hydrolase n=1 Tax=Streptomyces californicus TaxID=67351 RepID=UPI003711B22C
MSTPAHRRCPVDTTEGTCVPLIGPTVGALLLDFDGTLADTRRAHEDALRTALEPYGIPLNTAWYDRHVGLSIHDLLARLPGGGALPHEAIVQRSRAHLLATLHTMTAIPCVVALLEQARRAKLPCAVASGATRQLVGPGLETLGLAGEFDTVVAREDATRGKPDPELYLTAARRLGVEPEHCLAVDDAPDGIAAARAAGMHVLTVIEGHLAPAGPEAAASGPGPRTSTANTLPVTPAAGATGDRRAARSTG